MRHEKTRRLFDYWNNLRDGRLAPYRSEVDPRAIAPLLESTFILEHSDAATPRFRLAGTKLCDQFGLELRGMSALALWHGECRNRLRELLGDVVDKPCVGHVACTVETRGGRMFDAEFLYLPLRSDLGEMTRILGCGYYMGGFEHAIPGNEPLHHWIDSVNIHAIDAPAEALRSARPGQYEQTPQRRETQLADFVRFKREKTPPALRAIEGGLKHAVAAETRGPSERPALRLVKSDAS